MWSITWQWNIHTPGLSATKAISTLFGNDVYGEAHLAGRALSAVADTGTVFLTAWIARRFFGRPAGLLHIHDFLRAGMV